MLTLREKKGKTFDLAFRQKSQTPTPPPPRKGNTDPRKEFKEKRRVGVSEGGKRRDPPQTFWVSALSRVAKLGDARYHAFGIKVRGATPRDCRGKSG